MSKFTRVAVIDPENNPLFARLWGESGFKKLNESTIDEFLAVSGLKFAIFADDPNKQKETMDIVVIGPEIFKQISKAFTGAWMTEPAEGRALAARFGMRKLPALALFRDGVYLGACEGLDSWDGYITKLAEIAVRKKAPPRTITILPKAPVSDSACG
ncbi:hydrogenase expression protein HyaE [Sutterella sp.]|uniref:hydrogenase expression protein HyaE n=1 Tax=Sutterella sp. TaxID=1981025 RepID=UPI0026E0F4AB|nr:hydrogenase expression protein HyaE [Sutterella sp.]MDO5530758.1 hydrogenase expression protein HyaE [Sutterella sp.]